MASEVVLNTGFCYQLLHVCFKLVHSQSLPAVPQLTPITARQRSSVKPPFMAHSLQIQSYHLCVAARIVNLHILLNVFELNSACSAQTTLVIFALPSSISNGVLSKDKLVTR